MCWGEKAPQTERAVVDVGAPGAEALVSGGHGGDGVRPDANMLDLVGELEEVAHAHDDTVGLREDGPAELGPISFGESCHSRCGGEEAGR